LRTLLRTVMRAVREDGLWMSGGRKEENGGSIFMDVGWWLDGRQETASLLLILLVVDVAKVSSSRHHFSY
jgi:hypothetical protein